MKRVLTGLLAITLALGMWGGSAQAFELVQPADSGNARLEAGKKIDDTVFTAGQDVDIRGDVAKDLFAAGENVTVAGHVDGNLIAGGATVKVTGPVKGDLIVTGGTFILGSESHVLGDVFFFGGTAELLGTVDGKVTAYAGDVAVGSKVGGDLTVQADTLTLGDKASVGGAVKGTLGTALDDAAKAKVAGGVTATVQTSAFSKTDVAQGLRAATVLAEIYKLLSLIATGLILLLLFPKRFEAIRAESMARVGASALSGLVALVFLPIVFMVSAVFFITLPLGFLALALFAVLALVGSVAANLWVGDLLGKHSWPAFSSLVVGAVVLALLTLVPFIGPFLVFVAWLVGFGSVLRLTWGHLSKGGR